ncbi:MAG: ribonuclease P protein component [Verrucomicrobia bacterium]|nr:ribonuclease P protein component [Verrucomicrobiota bacterium]
MAASGHGFRFRDSQRIRYSWEFASLKATGQREFSRTMIMNWRPSTDRPYSRLGVVVSKRVGGSVTRSRTRRLLREAFRQFQPQMIGSFDMVLVARKMISGASQEAVNQDLMRLLGRAKALGST